MMVSPEGYINQFKNASYEEMIDERDSLFKFLKEYETKEKAGDRSGGEWQIHPQPDVIYQMYMEYLAELIPLMHEKYSEEYVWGDKRLSRNKAGQAGT